MSVTQKLMGLGSFRINLTEDYPESRLDDLELMGHIVVTQNWIDPNVLSDLDFRNMARYVGVVTRKPSATRASIEGSGLLWWLGDGEKGVILRGTDKQVFVNESFNDAISAVIGITDSPITKGTVETPAGTMTQTFDLVTQRRAIEDICLAFGSEFKVTNAFTLDAGASGSLFVGTPEALVARKGVGGDDPAMKGMPSEEIKVTSDIEDWVSTVIVAAEGTGETLQTSESTLGTIPYNDPQGNPSARAVVINEPSTPADEASAKADAYLEQYGIEHREVTLDLKNFYVAGEFTVGDVIYVYDPKTELVDTSNEVAFRGELLQPIGIRVVGMSWPVTEQMGVYYRDGSGNYTDLTDFVKFDTGSVRIEVGDDSRNLVEGKSAVLDARISTDPDGNDTIGPAAVPLASTPWTGALYVDDEGKTTSSIVAVWTEPDNTDSTPVTDGSYYDIRYRQQGDTVYQHQSAPWGVTSAQITGLAPGVVYEVSVAASDVNGNLGPYSSNEVVTAPANAGAPSQPAAPTLAGNELNIQVTHDLQKQASGDLESDLDHLNVYGSTSTGFTPSSANFLGEIKASQAHIALGINVVQSFPLADTSQRYVVVTAVNRVGSESPKSPEATVTAVLLDDSHISDLSASKITAGTISAQVVQIGGVAGAIQSTNYSQVSGSEAGWKIDSDGNAWFNSAQVYGDLISSNWGGARPADLSSAPDTSGTPSGFYLDSSAGAAQFEGTVWFGGDLKIYGGGVLATGLDTETRMEVSASAKWDTGIDVDFYTTPLGSGTASLIHQKLVSSSSTTQGVTWKNLYFGTGEALVFATSTGPATYLALYSANGASIRVEGTGTASTPNFTFIGDLTTGIYQIADGQVGISSNASTIARFISGGIMNGGNATGGFWISRTTGSASAPVYSFANDTDLGFYRPNTNRVGVAPSLTGVAATSALPQEHHGLMLLGGGMNTTSNQTAALMFGSTDSSFTTKNPKMLAAITGEALETFGSDTAGAMGLSFFGAPPSPGTSPDPALIWRMVKSSGSLSRLYGQERTTSVDFMQQDPVNETWSWWLNNTEYVKFSTSGFVAKQVYSADFGGGSAVYADSTGQLHINTSARKTKANVKPADRLADIELQPVIYNKKGRPSEKQYGFIADDLATQDAVLGVFVDGEVSDFTDRGLMAVMAAKLKRLEAEVTDLRKAAA